MQTTPTSSPNVTSVELSWDAAKSNDYNESWEYGIYYALNAADLLAGMLLVGKRLA
jgi:hypothetical protein